MVYVMLQVRQHQIVLLTVVEQLVEEPEEEQPEALVRSEDRENYVMLLAVENKEGVMGLVLFHVSYVLEEQSFQDKIGVLISLQVQLLPKTVEATLLVQLEVVLSQVLMANSVQLSAVVKQEEIHAELQELVSKDQMAHVPAIS